MKIQAFHESNLPFCSWQACCFLLTTFACEPKKNIKIMTLNTIASTRERTCENMFSRDVKCLKCEV